MAPIQAGQTIGPYRIIQQIGQGGMATVYKAFQPAMERYVALKILPQQLAESPEFTGRFQQEARTIARLEHAYILPVHDFGESDGYTYLAMRYVEGGTLSDRLRAGPPTAAEVNRWFGQLADALDYAHAQGVVHRDLKPSNVLLDTRGNLFLTDFGIAKLLEADKRFTGTGTMIGTPAYMSPEQGQGLRVDQRTDIYSLGIMLYEMVTGRVPFDADTPVAIILKHINDPLPLPSSISPNITPAAEQVLLKALAKNPADRFATAGQFAAAWSAAQRATTTQQSPSPAPVAADRTSAAALPGAPGAAPPSGAVARPHRPGRFAFLGAGAAVVIGLLVCGGLVVAVALNQQRRPATLQPTAPPTGSSAVQVAATSAAVATASTAVATGPTVVAGVASPVPQWRSWAAGNDVLSVALFNGDLISGGRGGLTRWKLSDGSVTGRMTTGNGLPNPHVTALVVDDQAKRLWIATEGGAVAFDGQNTTVYDQSTGLDSNTVTALARTKRGILAGTAYGGVAGGGLDLFNNDHWQPVAGFPSSADSNPTSNQLSDVVTTILEDSHANVWVGTSHGLGRYDGQTWTSYFTADGLPDNEITALAEAGGTLWVGTNSGIATLEGNAFVAYAPAQGQAIRGVFLAANGDLWFEGAGGIARRPAAGGSWQTYDQSRLPAYIFSSGLEAPGGTLYFGSDAGVVRFDGRVFDLWAIPNVPRRAGYLHILAGQKAGQLWFVPDDSSATDLFDPASATWLPGPTLPCDSCLPLTWGPDGRLWGGSDQGMWIIQGSDATHLTSAQGLPDGAAWAVAFARDGSAWIGTSSGVAVYAGGKVTTVFTAANAGLADNSVKHLLAAADGSMWVATNANLSQYSADGHWSHYGAGNPFQTDQPINGLAQDASGAIWVATNSEGVYRFANNTWTQFRPGISGVKLPSTDVTCITTAPDGSVWFGTSQAGAARFDGKSWQSITVADGLIDANVNDLYIDSTGVVWFATSGGITAYRP